MIIYKVTNLITKKNYIGKSTKTLAERKKSHLKNVKRGILCQFYNSIRKHGENNFIWEIIIECNEFLLLNELEIFFIKKYDSFKNGYNMTLGGEGGDTISNKSNEEKKNQGVKNGNVPWNKGIPMKKLGYNFEGRKLRNPFTEKQKLEHSKIIKNSDAYRIGLKNRKHGKSRMVFRVSDKKSWETIKDCSIFLNIKKGKLRYMILKNIPINGEYFSFK